MIDSLQISETLSDIGTDHALAALTAVSQGKARRVIAADIHNAPLLAAKCAVTEAGLQQRIIVLQSDGLQNIAAQDMQQVIIAGMGGLLIRSILEDAVRRTPQKFDACRRLVLQPMNHQEELRYWLARQGWPHIEERLLSEKRRFYQIIVTRPGNEPYELDWLAAWVGPCNLARGDEAVCAYMRHEIAVRRRILREILQGHGSVPQKEDKLRREIAVLERALADNPEQVVFS